MNIPDFQFLTRLQNILGSPQPTFGGAVQNPNIPLPQMQQPIQPMQQEPNNMAFADDWMRQNYQPRTQFADMLSGLMTNIPQPQEVSGWRKFGSALAGMGSEDPAGTAYKLANLPYLTQMQQWEGQLEPTMKAAGLEQDYNQNARIMAEQTLQRILQERRDEETRRRNQAQEQLAQQKVDIQDRRANAYIWKQNHPNHVYKVDNDGYLISINPQTNETTRLPIKSNEMSEFDRLNFLRQTQMIIQDKMGERQKENILLQGDQARQTKATPSGGTSGTTAGTRPIDVSRMRFNRAQRATLEHPEWAEFIIPGPNNTFQIILPGQRGTGRNRMTPEMYNQIRQYILEPETPVSSRGGTSTTSTTTPAIPPDRIVVEKNGQRFTVPKSQEAQAIAEGYKVVK